MVIQSGDKVSIKRQIGMKKDEFFIDGKTLKVRVLLNNFFISKQQVENYLESAGLTKANPYFSVAQGKVCVWGSRISLN